jgi:predicted RNA methylase
MGVWTGDSDAAGCGFITQTVCQLSPSNLLCYETHLRGLCYKQIAYNNSVCNVGPLNCFILDAKETSGLRTQNHWILSWPLSYGAVRNAENNNFLQSASNSFTYSFPYPRSPPFD